VADFIGQANFVQSKVLDQSDGRLALEALGTTLTVPTPEHRPAPGAMATLVIRPEMVEVGSSHAQVQGIVRRATYLGNVIEYDIEVAGQLLALVQYDPRHTTVHSEGETVQLRFLDDCLYVLPDSG
jgi:iron(III) transport system ATP-binding protein